MLSLERCLCPISTLCDITNSAASCLEKLKNSCVLKLYLPFFFCSLFFSSCSACGTTAGSIAQIQSGGAL